MKSFNQTTIEKCFNMTTGLLLEKVAENKGFFKNLIPSEKITLDKLHTQAIIFSAESSNRIENIRIEHKRLKPLLTENSKPLSRSEEEVLGYKNALKYIYNNSNVWKKIDQEELKYFHKLSHEGNIDSIRDDAGKFKNKDNNIYEELESGEVKLRFQTISATETSHYIQQLDMLLADHYNKEVSPLILISLYILDFLCIHPFRDGNGRTSRLLTVALLMHNGYDVCKYISIEKIIESRLDEYYEVLKISSIGWHQSNHDPAPWVLFFLSVLNEAYREIKDQTSNLEKITRKEDSTLSKKEFVISAINKFRGKFTRAELEKACPTVSSSTIKEVLNNLKGKQIQLIGKGRSAYWVKI